MPKGYHHLTYELRCQLFTLKKRGDSSSKIAQELGFHRTTIYRELARNSGEDEYHFMQADVLAKERRSVIKRNSTKLTSQVIALIDSKLSLQWSPEQIAGWMKKGRYPQAVSFETIYQYIWKDKRQGGVLFKQLRHSGKKYKRRGANKAGRCRIPNRIDIDSRPSIVGNKCRLGDWELDTIIGSNHRGAIVSMVDRASKLTKLAKVEQNTALEVSQALENRLMPIRQFVLTLTADNGMEFAYHQSVSQLLEADFFFTKPYHPWERGLNEHTNGLVRQYFPKKTSFVDITQKQLEEIEILLNNRPRKVLGYLTPIEAFDELSKRSEVVALHT